MSVYIKIPQAQTWLSGWLGEQHWSLQLTGQFLPHGSFSRRVLAQWNMYCWNA